MAITIGTGNYNDLHLAHLFLPSYMAQVSERVYVKGVCVGDLPTLDYTYQRVKTHIHTHTITTTFRQLLTCPRHKTSPLVPLIRHIILSLSQMNSASARPKK